MKTKPYVLGSESNVFERGWLSSDSFVVVLVKNKKQVFSTISKYFLVDKGKFLDR